MARDEVVRLRLTAEQKEYVKGVAAATGLSMSDYIRERIFGGDEIYGNSPDDPRYRTRSGNIKDRNRTYKSRT